MGEGSSVAAGGKGECALGVEAVGGQVGVADVGDQAVVGVAREGDACLPADGAVGAVGADQPASGEFAFAVGGAYVQGHLVGGLAEGGQLVFAADVGVEGACVVVQDLFDAVLGYGQGVERVVGQRVQVEGKAAELVSGCGLGSVWLPGEWLVEAAQVQSLDDPADEAVGAGCGVRSGVLVEDGGGHAGELQFGGQE
ncbi:hypothetical protein OG811_26495 [Micromonospora sp. NBC_01638]|nr:hypothetical protein OG811_26495 [Micromonospora sp. NBC_01638]